MEWHEDSQLLMTCSKDKSIKLWKFPDIWVDEVQVEKSIIPQIAQIPQIAHIAQTS
jgi:WD40 repeat protein